MSSALSFDALVTLTRNQLGVFDVPCPLCARAYNPRKRVARLWRETEDLIRFNCTRCGAKGSVRDTDRSHGAPARTRPAPMRQERQPSEAERTASALSIWREAHGRLTGTPVESYLTHSRSEGGRGVSVPLGAAGETVRFHPSCPFGSTRTTAMVCLVRDIRTNEPKAIHRTALSADGRKVKFNGGDRLTLGPVGGGAIKLTADEDVTVCLGIGEGIETVLSLRNLPEFGPSPVWSLISAGGVESFPVLPGIESLWIAVDHDANGRGQQASRSTALRWQAAGAEVFLKTPSAPGADLNDLFTAGAGDA